MGIAHAALRKLGFLYVHTPPCHAMKEAEVQLGVKPVRRSNSGIGICELVLASEEAGSTLQHPEGI